MNRALTWAFEFSRAPREAQHAPREIEMTAWLVAEFSQKAGRSRGCQPPIRVWIAWAIWTSCPATRCWYRRAATGVA